jgi:hypothetical protein
MMAITTGTMTTANSKLFNKSNMVASLNCPLSGNEHRHVNSSLNQKPD